MRHGPGGPTAPSADGLGGPRLERRPASPLAADAFRRRRESVGGSQPGRAYTSLAAPGRGRQDVSLRLCRAVVRVDAMLAQKLTEPLDLIAQGWEGGPLPLAGGPVVLQLPFPVAQCRC